VTLRITALALVFLAPGYSACGRGRNASLAARGASSTVSTADQRMSRAAPICPSFLTDGDTTAYNEPLSDALLGRGHEAAATESLTVATLGSPSERRAQYNTTYADTIVRLRYAGLEVGFYKEDDGREFLGGLTLTSPHCEVLPGVSVGASAASLSGLFGAPVNQSTVADSLLVQFQAGEPGPVGSYIDFVVLRDTIRAIHWQFGID